MQSLLNKSDLICLDGRILGRRVKRIYPNVNFQRAFFDLKRLPLPPKMPQTFQGVTEAQTCQLLLCWNKRQQDAIQSFDDIK